MAGFKWISLGFRRFQWLLSCVRLLPPAGFSVFIFYFDFSSPNNIFTGTDQVETSGLTGSQGLIFVCFMGLCWVSPDFCLSDRVGLSLIGFYWVQLSAHVQLVSAGLFFVYSKFTFIQFHLKGQFKVAFLNHVLLLYWVGSA